MVRQSVMIDIADFKIENNKIADNNFVGDVIRLGSFFRLKGAQLI